MTAQQARNLMPKNKDRNSLIKEHFDLIMESIEKRAKSGYESIVYALKDKEVAFLISTELSMPHNGFTTEVNYNDDVNEYFLEIKW